MLQKNSIAVYNLTKNLSLHYVNDGYELDIKQIKKYLKLNIPNNIFSNIDIVYYYDLKNNKKAYASDDTIFINSKTCKNNQDFLKSLIHESGHSLFEIVENLDSFDRLKEEFIRKKHKVLDRLKNKFSEILSNSEEFNGYYNDFDKNEKFESFIEDNLGFDILFGFSNPYFPSPYSIMSLQEYFCVGLEIYYFENKEWLQQYCPHLFETLKLLEKVLHE